MLADYAVALAQLPDSDAQAERDLKQQRAARIQQYIQDLIAYANGEIQHLEVIPSVTPWTDEQIQADIERIKTNLTRFDRMKAFAQFVNAESHALVKFAVHPGFVIQQAYNSANAGPVAEAGKFLIDHTKDQLLLLHHPSYRPDYNPYPLFLKMLETDNYGDYGLHISITPDGLRVLSGTIVYNSLIEKREEYQMKIWDMQSGNCLKTFIFQSDGAIIMSNITPNGKRFIVYAEEQNILAIYDLTDEYEIRTLNMKKEMKQSDEEERPHNLVKRIYLKFRDKIKALHQAEQFDKNCSSEQSSPKINITSNGKRAILMHSLVLEVFSSLADGEGIIAATIWDIEKGKCLNNVSRNLKIHAVTSDGKFCIAEEYNHLLSIWDLEKGNCLNTLQGHTDSIALADITVDRRYAISISNMDRTLRIWDLEKGICLNTLQCHHTGSITLASITADGKYVVSISNEDNTLRIWDLQKGIEIKRFTTHIARISNMGITPDGRIAVLGSRESGIIWICDLERGRSARYFDRHASDYGQGDVRSIALNINGNLAVSGGFSDGNLKLWDIEHEQGKCLKTIKGDVEESISTAGVTTTTSRSCVLGVSFTPDETHILFCNASVWGVIHPLLLWECVTGKYIRTFDGHKHGIARLKVSPDGRTVITHNENSDIPHQVYDLEEGVCLAKFEGQTDYLSNITVFPDGRNAVLGKHRLIIWGVHDGKFVKESIPISCNIEALDITSDGRTLLTIGDDSILYIWNVRKEAHFKKIELDKGTWSSISILSDGRKAIVSSGNTTLWLLDIENGECLAIYKSKNGIGSLSEIRRNQRVIYGTVPGGEIVAIELFNLALKFSIVTPVRLWLFGTEGTPGHWNNDITTFCHWCGQRFPVAATILDVIHGISRAANLSDDQSPCLNLPNEAWDDPQLLSECPLCHRPLKFNPFLVDNRER